MYKGISCNTHSAVWNDSLVQAAMITYHDSFIDQIRDFLVRVLIFHLIIFIFILFLEFLYTSYSYPCL